MNKKVKILLPLLIAFSGAALAQTGAPQADKSEDLTGIQRLLAKQDLSGPTPAAAKPVPVEAPAKPKASAMRGAAAVTKRLPVEAVAKPKHSATPVVAAVARHPDAAEAAAKPVRVDAAAKPKAKPNASAMPGAAGVTKRLPVEAVAKPKHSAAPVVAAVARHPDAADLADPAELSAAEPALQVAVPALATPQVATPHAPPPRIATPQVSAPIVNPTPVIDSFIQPTESVTALHKARVLSQSERMYLKREETLIQQIRLLELQARAAELRKTIDGNTSRSSVAPDSVSVPVPVPEAISVPTTGIAEPPPFRLISVWGEGSNLNADVVTNGIRVSLKAGDTAMGGWKVLEIAGDEIQVQKGRRIETVKLGG